MIPITASAYEVQVAWQPVAGVAGYKVHVRYAGESYGPPIDVGSGTAAAGGLRASVVDVQILGIDTLYSVTAYDAQGVQSVRSNELRLTYATAATVVDSDRDGLTDAEEDLDLDGVVDPGETDPANWDTDGDSIADGDEVEGKTDPTDADDGPCDVLSGPDPRCDDGDPCTNDICLAYICRRAPQLGSCDDGLACTTNDTCTGGVCAGTDACGGGDFCSPETGSCEAIGAYDRLWIPAATYPAMSLYGSMKRSAEYAGGFDADAEADSLSPLLVFADSPDDALEGGSGDAAAYTIVLPSSGEWYLWGRFYYPGDPGSNDANSFLASVDDGPAFKFGNNLDYFQRWHWDGDGDAESGAPRPLSLGYLEAGEHELFIEKREANPTPPRLDLIFMAMEPNDVPTDAEAVEVVDTCPSGNCGNQVSSVCGDASGDGRVTATDGWITLTSAIGLGGFCSLSSCDADGNGRVNATDAVAVMQAAVDLPAPLECPPTIGFGVAGADGLQAITISLDYSEADVRFADGQRALTCRPTFAGGVGATVHVSDDPQGGRLDISLEFAAPIDGDLQLAECRIIPTQGSVPDPESFTVSVMTYSSSKSGTKAPAVSATPVY